MRTCLLVLFLVTPVLAEDWARALGTINYEVTCGLSPRVPRSYVG